MDDNDAMGEMFGEGSEGSGFGSPRACSSDAGDLLSEAGSNVSRAPINVRRAPAGTSAFFSGTGHWHPQSVGARARGSARSDAGSDAGSDRMYANGSGGGLGGDAPRNQGPGWGDGEWRAGGPPHAMDMIGCGFDREHQGFGFGEVHGSAPRFRHGNASESPWQDYTTAGLADVKPIRSMCIANIPTGCFARDATRFTHWQTPMTNSPRAVNLATLVGLIFTPMSKGWLCNKGGENSPHEELNREDQTEKDRERVKRVHKYTFISEEDNSSMPMYAFAYEEIYNAEKTQVKFIRVWLHVFHKQFSVSELVRKLMDENCEQASHAGIGHCQNAQRKQNLVNENKKARYMAGGRLSSTNLEYFAGTQYLRTTNETAFLKLLGSASGRTDSNAGKPCVANLEENLPAGSLNHRMKYDNNGLGGTHPLSPEFLFNARRNEVLAWGTVDLDGSECALAADQFEVDNYFDQEGNFTIPDTCREKSCYFWMTDPSVLNIFDAPLPRPVQGNVTPGPELLRLYQEVMRPDIALDAPCLLDHFNNTMTGTDQTMEKLVQSMAETILTYDTEGATEAERICQETLRNYGQKDDGDDVVEVRQVLKEIAFDSNKIYEQVIVQWVEEENKKLEKMNADLRTGKHEDMMDVEMEDEEDHFEGYINKRTEFANRRVNVMRELAELQLRRMEQAFTSRVDSTTIPRGYRAVYNGLMKELEDMPEGTASVAFGLDNQMMDSDRTVFGNVMDWICRYFEDDCFIDGRDWRLIQELLVHCFGALGQQFSPHTWLLIFFGEKGNGKTIRTERFMAAFVPGWVVMSGPGSLKEGMQGNMSPNNGCNCIYDEMLDDLTEGDGTNRTEFWKQILSKGEYVYNKPVPVQRSDGTTVHKTMKLKTPHDETHAVMTNRGPAFTKGKEEPSSVKEALIDRSSMHLVRTLGSQTRSDAEFQKHASTPEARRRTRMFRILTCLTAMVKMFVYRQPYFQPEMAWAQRVWDYLDKKMLNGEYNLPIPSPRKNQKRVENCNTFTAMNAVATVFFYKQTAFYTHAGGVDEENDFKPRPFKIEMLWEAVQMLQPTPEIVLYTWVMGLEYHVGTSTFAVNAMTAACETFGFQVQDYFMKPPGPQRVTSEFKEDAQRARERAPVMEPGGEGDDSEGEDGTSGRQASKKKKKQQPRAHFFQPIAGNQQPIMEKMLRVNPGPSEVLGMTLDEAEKRRKQFEGIRKERAMYRHLCHESTHREAMMKDPFNQIGWICTGQLPPPEDGVTAIQGDEGAPSGGPRNEGASDASAVDLDEEEFCSDQPPEAGDPPEYFWFWHNKNAQCFPGPANCQLGHMEGHDTPEGRKCCPYCSKPDRNLDDVEPESEKKPVEDVELAYRTSTGKVFPTVLEAATLYAPQAVVQWCCGEVASSADIHNPVAGTCSRIKYKEKGGGSGGAAQYDLAWLANKGERFSRSGEEMGGHTWGSFAHQVKHGTGKSFGANMGTCKMFDFTVEALKDTYYLLSTVDNQRRCPEEPMCPHYRAVDQAFVNGSDGKFFSERDVPQTVKIRDVGPGKHSTTMNSGEWPSRPEECNVDDCEMQRQMDYLVQNGRLRAAEVLASNRITLTPPIRLVNGVIEVNVGAVFDHMSFVAESMLRCVNVPGIRNQQERFCKGSTGPQGTSVKVQNPVGKGGGVHLDTGDGVHTIPFSFDVTSIALGLEAMSRFYNPMAERELKNTNDEYGPMGLKLTANDVPQMSTRFAGYSEKNRQTVTTRVAWKKSDSNQTVDVGKLDENEAAVSLDHVSKALGREASEEDYERYVQARQGVRNMRGVEGDLFSFETWQKYTLASLQARGLVSCADSSTHIVNMIRDMPLCFMARGLEQASQKGIKNFGSLNIQKAVSMCYETQEKKEREQRNSSRSHAFRGKKRKLVQELDGMGMNKPNKLMNFMDEEPARDEEFVAQGGREDVRFS